MASKKKGAATDGLAVQLLRLMSIRGTNDYVERFHVFAKTCSDATDLLDAFTKTHERILCALRIRVAKSDQELEVDTLEIDEKGVIRFRCGTKLDHKHAVPPMSLRVDESGGYARPGRGEGVAPFCIWANTGGARPGIALAHDVGDSPDIEYFNQTVDPSIDAIGWYKPETIAGVYKQPPKGKAPYRSLLTAPIVQVYRASGDLDETPDAKCIGVLNVTSTAAEAFSIEDCAWIQTCASLLGSLYESYSSRQLELIGRASLPAPESLHELPEVAEPTPSSPAVTSRPAQRPEQETSRLRAGAIRPWSTPEIESFLYRIKVCGGAEQTEILQRLERDGFVLIRWEGVGPAADRLLSFEQWLGQARTRQNDWEGPIKPISPKPGLAANSGDSADELDPHVDGTQDEVTPAILAFEYETTATYGAVSTFIDTAPIILALANEAPEVLTALAQPDVAVMEKKGLRFQGPLITTVRSDSIAVRLRFDDRLQAKDKVLTLTPKYADAFDRIKKEVFAASRLEFTHEEGDIALFDNWRVLHGRRALGKDARHPRLHKRMWIHDLVPRHQKHRLGVRGLAPSIVASIASANASATGPARAPT